MPTDQTISCNGAQLRVNAAHGYHFLYSVAVLLAAASQHTESHIQLLASNALKMYNLYSVNCYRVLGAMMPSKPQTIVRFTAAPPSLRLASRCVHTATATTLGLLLLGIVLDTHNPFSCCKHDGDVLFVCRARISPPPHRVVRVSCFCAPPLL